MKRNFLNIFTFSFMLLFLLHAPFPAFAEENGQTLPPERRQEEKLPGSAEIFQENIIFGQGELSPQVHSDTNTSSPLISYKIQGAGDETYTSEPPRTAGVYTARVLYPETETHQAAQATRNFTILAYVTGIRLEPLSQLPARNYNGSTQPVPVRPENLTFTFTVEGTSQVPQQGHDYLLSEMTLLEPWVSTDPGDRNIRIRLQLLEGLYAFSPQVQQEFFLHGDILPAPLTVTVPDFSGDVLPDLSQLSLEGLAPGDRLESADFSRKDQVLTAENLRIFREDREVTHQYLIACRSGTLQTRAEIRKDPVPAEDLCYNGQPQPLFSAPGEVHQGRMLYQLSYHASQDQDPEVISPWSQEVPSGILPGIYTVSYKAVCDGIFESEERSLPVVIAPRVLKLTVEGEKYYDGTRNLDPEDMTLHLTQGNILPGEEVIFKTLEGSTFSQIHVGDNLKITPGNLILEGKDAAHYTVGIARAQGRILPRPLKITVPSVFKKYGQKDPDFTFTAENLPGGESLRGTPDRTSGEEAGTYPLLPGGLTDNPNYQILFSGGNLKIIPASLVISMEASVRSLRPGKTFHLTVTAKNGEKDLMDGAWRQPEGLLLFLEDQEITPVYQGGGVWKAEVSCPRHAQGSLSLRAVLKDPNYEEGEALLSLPINEPTSNPFTGDEILAYGTLLALSLLALLGIGIHLHLKHRK